MVRLLALSGLVLLACGPPPDTGVNVVVQRVHKVRTASGEQLGAPPHQMGAWRAWRRAFETPIGEAFEIEVDPRARELVFGIAARASTPVRFRVSTPDGSPDLFSGTIDAASDGWELQRVPLPASAAQPRRLRFETAAQGAVGGGAAAFWSAPILLAPSRGAAAERPNLVLISIDTLGAGYLSSFGNAPGVSPNIDAFLDDSCSFRRAFSQYPNTLVSHASLFSGLHPRRHGSYPGGLFWGPSLVDSLADAGYRTVAITAGGFVAGGLGFTRGFDAYKDGLLSGHAEQTFGAAARWLASDGVRDRFFLFVHTYDVHAPYQVRDAAGRAIVQRLSPLYDSLHSRAIGWGRVKQHNLGQRPLSADQRAHLRALYSAGLHHVDRVVGGFLQQLKELGLAESTVVVLTSDHGEAFNEEKVGHLGTLHNSVLHVPLGFRWEGTIPPAQREAPVELVDVMPTLLDLAGLPLPDGLTGRSLAASIFGDVEDAPPAFAEVRGRRSGAGWSCAPKEPDCRVGRYAVQSRDFKLVRSWEPPSERLYDLRVDPEETRDVAQQHPGELAAQRARLESYFGSPAGDLTPRHRLDDETRKQLEALGYVLD
jgi:arylsulfatase A-like enzyme